MVGRKWDAFSCWVSNCKITKIFDFREQKEREKQQRLEQEKEERRRRQQEEEKKRKEEEEKRKKSEKEKADKEKAARKVFHFNSVFTYPRWIFFLEKECHLGDLYTRAKHYLSQFQLFSIISCQNEIFFTNKNEICYFKRYLVDLSINESYWIRAENFVLGILMYQQNVCWLADSLGGDKRNHLDVFYHL